MTNRAMRVNAFYERYKDIVLHDDGTRCYLYTHIHAFMITNDTVRILIHIPDDACVIANPTGLLDFTDDVMSLDEIKSHVTQVVQNMRNRI